MSDNPKNSMQPQKPSPRVLLLNPEFSQSFWNLQYLCDLQDAKALTPPLGLLTVAALLPQEWQLRLVDENVRRLTEADWDWAQFVLISAMIVQKKRLQELIQEAKARGKPVVVGGPYPTVMTEETLAWGADIVVRGELENQVAPFLAALQSGQTGVVLESTAKPDLSTSPIPRFDLLRHGDYVVLPIQTSRGCPFDCEFCDVVSLFGRKPRYKTPEQVLAELEAIHRQGPLREIFISDDNFIGNRAQARNLLQHMITWHKSRGEPFSFWTQTSVDLGHHPELIDLMTEANFNTVFIGIESPDEDILRSADKHHNVRHPLIESINTISANGLTVMGSFILGFDNESPGAGDRIAAFVEATNIPHVMLNLLTPLPHTRLWDRLEREGRLRTDRIQDDWRELDSIGGLLAFRPTRPEADILSEYLNMWDRLYARSNFLSRTYQYFLAMRPTRAALAQAKGEAPSPHPPNPQSDNLSVSLRQAYRFLRLAWWQGVKPASRRQFWTQLFSLLRRNPTRVYRYLNSCVIGEDMFHLQEVMHQRLTLLLEDRLRSDVQEKPAATSPAA